MSRRNRGKRAAIKAARLSQFYAHRVGAVLFKGSSQVATGINRRKTHPQSNCFTQHAEFNSLLKYTNNRDRKNLTMYVARLTRTDRISLSKPCFECQKAIWDAGIRKVFYTDYAGELKELVFDFQLLVA
jgi:deoxycytidylate deaminase